MMEQAAGIKSSNEFFFVIFFFYTYKLITLVNPSLFTNKGKVPQASENSQKA